MQGFVSTEYEILRISFTHTTKVANHLPENDLNIPDADRQSGEALTVHSTKFSVPEKFISMAKNIDG